MLRVYRYRSRLIVIALMLVGMGCGSGNSVDLSVLNESSSTEVIRVDLAGDARTLDIGDFTVYRSIKKGRHILTFEGTGATCTGTTRDTLDLGADTTIRSVVTRDSTGVCEIRSTISFITQGKPAPTAPQGP